MSKNDGGPAFPHVGGPHKDGNKIVYPVAPGMTLRDWYAGMAMQGVFASGQLPEGTTFGQLADQAWVTADAMLNARNK